MCFVCARSAWVGVGVKNKVKTETVFTQMKRGCLLLAALLLAPCAGVRLHISSSFPLSRGMCHAAATVCADAFCGSTFDIVSLSSRLEGDEREYEVEVEAKVPGARRVDGKGRSVFFEIACQKACESACGSMLVGRGAAKEEWEWEGVPSRRMAMGGVWSALYELG